MSVKLSVSHETKRGDVWELDLRDIKLGRNARVVPSTDEAEKIQELAYQIYTYGQQVPAIGHRDSEDRVVLDAGNRRYKAVELLHTGFTVKDDAGFETECKDENLTLKIVIDSKSKTPESAFVVGVLENIREGVSDIQEAEAQKVLREEFKWSDTGIARLYGQNHTNRVAALKKLLSLPSDVREAYDRGQIKSVDAALATAELPKDSRKELLATDEKITATKAREKSAEGSEESDETPAKLKAKPRNAAAFDKFVEEALEDLPEPAVKLIKKLKAWYRGKGTNKNLIKAFAEAFGVAADA